MQLTLTTLNGAKQYACHQFITFSCLIYRHQYEQRISVVCIAINNEHYRERHAGLKSNESRFLWHRQQTTTPTAATFEYTIYATLQQYDAHTVAPFHADAALMPRHAAA